MSLALPDIGSRMVSHTVLGPRGLVEVGQSRDLLSLSGDGMIECRGGGYFHFDSSCFTSFSPYYTVRFLYFALALMFFIKI